MQSQLWPTAIQDSADPQRAQEYFEQLKQSGAAAFLKNALPEQARLLATVLSASQALSEWLIANPNCVAAIFDPEKIQFPRQKQGLRRELEQVFKPLLASADYAGALTKIREIKQREMVRIAVRDLGRLSNLMEIVGEISDIADVCLDAVFKICWQQLTERFGTPYHLDANGRWQPTSFCVLGMGKLGGQELNYSSDVDLLFVYADEGQLFKTPPRKNETGKGMKNHQFFTRFCEAYISEINRLTTEGFLYRIDMRLRPEGPNAPLARSLQSYENYYVQWGQTWERMMLIKARGVAGDQELAFEFLEMVQPFRYPRSLSERVLREIAATKARIESEVVKAGELDRNVKLGRGGIREIEFVVQAQQLLNGGRTPFLQGAQTLPSLQKLVQYKLLRRGEAEELSAAYNFLRDVEHRLQMENNQQTHTIPTERKARERLAKLMGFETVAKFESAKKSHCAKVRGIYEKLLRSEKEEPAEGLPANFEDENAWKKLLAEHAFREPDKAFRLLKEFVEGPGFVHVSARTSELAMELLPKFLTLCPKAGFQTNTLASIKNNRANLPKNGSKISPLAAGGEQGEGENAVTQSHLTSATAAKNGIPILSDPDRVLARLDTFITAYGARSMLYDLWTSNPSLFTLLLLLFDRSEFLAEVAIRDPGLVDELELSGRLRRSKTADETLRDLRHGIEDEDQKLWLRRYHHAEFMRIGLRDILGLADFEQNLVELTALADACLQYALEVVMRKNKLRAAPFCIIGMGKLGGQEITYGSDLDIIFVADSKNKNLASLQKSAAEIMDLLSAKTEQGSVFVTDARLRPDGEKGLLVNSLKAYEDYYRNRAQLWEIQSLTRTRPIAGDLKTGEQFQKIAAALTNFSQPSLPLSAFTPDWKNKIAQMRLRIEKERTPPGKNHLAIKTGTGGLVDAEFLAQAFCLENGWQEANTLRALERARAEKILSASDAETLISNYRELRRIEGILRRWSYEGETELPDDPAPLYRVAVRCGFKNAEEFMAAVKKFREGMRSVYAKILKTS